MRAPLSPYRQSEYMHVWKNNTDGQSLPRVGKVASTASRIGCWRHENKGKQNRQCVCLKYAVNESTLSTPAGHLSLERKAIKLRKSLAT